MRTDETAKRWMRRGFMLGFAIAVVLAVWWTVTALSSSSGEGLEGALLVALVFGAPVSLLVVPLIVAGLPYPGGYILVVLAILLNWSVLGWLAGFVIGRVRRN